MRIIHFDVGASLPRDSWRDGESYIDIDINSYVERNGHFQAEIVTGLPTSHFDEEVISSIKGLKLIVTRSIGVDNIDKEYCKRKNIQYHNVQYSNYNVVHHTMALILYHSRQFQKSFSQIQSGVFDHEKIDCLDLSIRTLGIVGYGRIGKAVAELADIFGIKVIACDRKYRHGDFIDGFEMYDFDDLIEMSDIISLHCDANPTNLDIINEETIKRMKDGVVLINTARGSLVNEDDLIKNIDKFSFVGLDVLQNEKDFDSNHPFLKQSKIFITPHTAYKSEVISKERWDLTYKYIDEFVQKFNYL